MMNAGGDFERKAMPDSNLTTSQTERNQKTVGVSIRVWRGEFCRPNGVVALVMLRPDLS